MSFHVQPRPTPIRLILLAFLSATAFFAAAAYSAQARDFEMGGDSNLQHHGARARHRAA